MSRFKFLFTVLLVAIIASTVGITLGIFYQRSFVDYKTSTAIANDKLLFTLSQLHNKYVDTLDLDSIYEIAIPSILEKLDPHSAYVPAKDFAAMSESMNGKFDGIGVMFNMLTDTVKISNVISGGPCAKTGVAAGDMIIKVNGNTIAGEKIPSDSVVKMLKGKRGSIVNISVKRGSNKKLIEFEITRGEIPMRSVEAAFIDHENTGYLKISRFASTTYNEMINALVKLKNAGMEKLVLDLRNNGGGFLDQAIYITNEFLEKGEGIVYTEGLKSPRVEHKANGRGQFRDLPLVVMMNPESASASEILAGALQDNDRATIVGLRSFGKGLVQEQFEYADGSAARITVAKYYTPLGRSIQKPYDKNSKEDYNMEIYKRMTNSEFLDEDSVKVDVAQQVVTPKGDVLYGGGGIYPDVFVPMDTTSVTPYFRKLIENNLIFLFATEFTDNNRAEINNITTFKQFDKLIDQQDLYLDFVAWADRKGVKPSTKDFSKSRTIVVTQLKAYIGQNTQLQENAFYHYIKPLDNTMLKAYEVIDLEVAN